MSTDIEARLRRISNVIINQAKADPLPTIALIVLFISITSFPRRKPGFCYSFQE